MADDQNKSHVILKIVYLIELLYGLDLNIFSGAFFSTYLIELLWGDLGGMKYIRSYYGKTTEYIMFFSSGILFILIQ